MQHEIFEEKALTLKENNLRSPVKSCFYQNWAAREKKGELIYGTCFDRHTSWFNPQGYLIKKAYYSIGKKSLEKPLDETITFKVNCEYLDNTYIIRKLTTNKSGKKIIFLTEYEYDDAKRVVREYRFMGEHDGYLSRKTEYRYDYFEKGHKKIVIHPDTPSEREELIYDPKGRIIAKLTFSQEGKQMWEKSEWDYDDIALTETLRWSEKNFLQKTYNLQEKLIETLSIKEGEIYEKQNYEYNPEGLLIKQISQYQDTYYAIDEYFYDEYQNLIRVKSTIQRETSLEESEKTNLYEYDKHGNWITQKCYENKKLRAIIKRQIEYFEP